MEIHRLRKMLEDAGIAHEWRDRDEMIPGLVWGHQILIKTGEGDWLVSTIEGAGSYGFGGFAYGLDGSDKTAGDSVEVLVKEQQPVGYLTAEEAFEIIKKALEVKT